MKELVASRVPPGDRWMPLDNETVILESLTEVLEYILSLIHIRRCRRRG